MRKFEAAPLAEGVADLDFAAAEAAWSDLIIDAQGRVEINAKAELALSEVVALMSDEAFDVQMNRMGLLLEKQFGTVVSEQLVGLLPVLKKYKDLEQRWWEENGNTIPPAYAELFQLQDEVLGETLAERLFSEQRQLANVMLASFQIQNDDALTQSEKEQALADLQRGLHPGGQDE